jgi:ribosomal protein L36
LIVYCQEKIIFDSYTEYKYQEDESKISKMMSTVLYNSVSNDYYLVLSTVNNKVKYVSLVDKNNYVSYKLKPNDFINKVNENKLKIISSYQLNLKRNLKNCKVIDRKSENIYVINSLDSISRNSEFSKYYIEYNPNSKNVMQIGNHPDLHIPMSYNFLDSLKYEVKKMYHISKSKKVRIFTYTKSGNANFSMIVDKSKLDKKK